MENLKIFKKKDNLILKAILYISVAFAIVFLNYLGFYSYDPAHNFIELITVILGIFIFVIAKNTYSIPNNKYFFYLGIVYGTVSFFALLHLLSFRGINIMAVNDENLSLQFSMTARAIEAISLFLTPLIIKKNIKHYKLVIWFALINFILVFMIYDLRIFPQLYIDSKGSTPIKTIIELMIMIAYILAFISLNKNKKLFHQDILKILSFSIASALVCEIIFVYDKNLYDGSMLIGHVFRLIALYLVYKATTEKVLKEPFNLLFYEVYKANMELTKKSSELRRINDELMKENNERKNAEEKIKKSEEKYRQVVELFPDGIILHKNNNIVYVSKPTVKIFGFQNENDIIGKNIYELIHPEFMDIVTERIGNILKNGGVNLFLEEKLLKSDGSLFYAEVTNTIYSYDNSVIMTIIRDITERKRSEKEIKELNEALEIDKIKTEFFANMSHEFRTPINVIFSAVQILEFQINKANSKSHESYTNYIKIMKQNCYRLLRLTNNIIDITRIDSGFYKPNFRNMDIVKEVEDNTLSIVQYASEKSINIVFDTNVEEKIMAFDPDKVERVILNLLSNAVKFSRRGGKILVNLYDKVDFVTITVKDTGIGIPEDKLDLIFQRFRQVDKSFFRRNEGSGIGLYLVKSLVEMHEGTIIVKSVYGKGSEFIVELPVRTVEEDHNKKEIAVDSGSIQNAKIEFSDVYT